MRVSRLLLTLTILAVPAYGFAATLNGTVTYDGEAPKFKPISMAADALCQAKHSGEVFPQKLILGSNKELSNVFVYVKGGLSGQKFTTPATEMTITQDGCMYSPHVSGVMVGQTVKILNPDGTLHNVHSMSKANEEFNMAMPKFRKEITVTFSKPEFMFPLKCDVHPWMEAWLSVMEHPFFATSGTDGKFQITDLPAGTYEIEAWHEKMGTQTVSVTVGADETKELNFTFTKPAKKE